jgi:hypothetical protein
MVRFGLRRIQEETNMIFGLFKSKKQKQQEAFEKAVDEAFRNIIVGKMRDARVHLEQKYGKHKTHN